MCVQVLVGVADSDAFAFDTHSAMEYGVVVSWPQEMMETSGNGRFEQTEELALCVYVRTLYICAPSA